MLRIILAVVVGYIVMFVVTMVGMIAMLPLAGTSVAELMRASTQPGSIPPPPVAYSVASLVLGVFAAMLGGMVALRLGKASGARAVHVLAGLVLVLGVLHFFRSNGRTPEPTWYLAALPIVGAVGVLIGGRVRKRAVTM